MLCLCYAYACSLSSCSSYLQISQFTCHGRRRRSDHDFGLCFSQLPELRTRLTRLHARTEKRRIPMVISLLLNYTTTGCGMEAKKRGGVVESFSLCISL